MQTILGQPYVRPTPEDIQALIRKAHQERSDVLRGLLAALFTRRRHEAEVAQAPMRAAA
jgi:hypothetical protein